MQSFKVTLDRIEGNTAVLLLRMKRRLKLISPSFYCLLRVRRMISWTSQLPEMCRRQRTRKKEHRVCLKSLKRRIERLNETALVLFYYIRKLSTGATVSNKS